MSYDSRPDTEAHIAQVRHRLDEVIDHLRLRGLHHDASKLEEPEKSVFDEFTPKLRDSTYGSGEYKAFLAGMGEGLDHHYELNDHHPEHFVNGIADMDLLQIIEMLCDWKAATERHADGDLARSIIQNADRFGYGYRVTQTLGRTAAALGWIRWGEEDIQPRPARPTRA